MKITFPEPQDLKVNMMPFIMGDKNTLPEVLHGYWPMIQACNFEVGTTVYLTVDESAVLPNESQRRGGIHTEAFKPSDASYRGSWGGGWGGKKGLYMASTDGECRIWEIETDQVDNHGAVLEDLSNIPSYKCEPNTLYWMTDKTPHEALPTPEGNYRQFFRLVSEDVSVWFTEHNTPNPLGIQPGCPLIHTNKFT